MSYDFSLFLPQPGVEPIITAQAKLNDETEEIDPGPPVAAKEARKQAIAAALMQADPALEVFRCRFDEIARFQNITIEEAKVRFRQMELNGPKGGPGIQIALFDDRASLTVPYWHKDKHAKAVFAKLWEYLKVIQKVGGYQIYDPQMECIINLASDLEDATKCYTDVVERIG